MDRRIRTLILAAPFLALASCQIVSGLSGVDLNGNGNDLCSKDGPSLGFEKCGSELFDDEDLIRSGAKCTFPTKATCASHCDSANVVPTIGLVAVSGTACKANPAAKCLGGCKSSCTCKSGETPDCYAVCSATCLAECKGNACSDLCAGGCAYSCSHDSTCDGACSGACTVVAKATCLENDLATYEAQFRHNCNALCMSGTDQAFCDGVLMADYQSKKAASCAAWLHTQGVTPH